MCGIAGVFSNRDARRVTGVMTDSIHHRGPDDVGIEELASNSAETAGAFGHRRLAIIDLSANGHQPMFSADRNLCLTFNGEIYNFIALRGELEKLGTHFRSVSDTEVILAGWRHFGPRFVERLRGMFALAMWDRDAGKGYLVRDTFGIKPLYAAERDGQVLFASEVRALLATDLIPRTLSPAGVASYLSTGSVAEPLTIVAGVSSVPAGCIVEVLRDANGFSLRPPVSFAKGFESSTGSLPRSEHVKRIRSALEESVAYHLVSDVPVGVFLSGGIDSTAVAGLASQAADIPLESFTVIFNEVRYSEADRARATAQRFGMNHHEVMLSGSDLLNALPDVFSSMDQPSLDGLNTFVVSRSVRSYGLKAVLSGLGGDELFGGYPSFLRAQRMAALWKLPAAVREFGAAVLTPFDELRTRRVRSMLTDSDASSASYRASRTLFDDELVDRLMNSDEPRTKGDAAASALGMDLSKLSIAQRVSLYELTGYMRNTLLRDSDVFTMAHALELRVPLVDTEVAQVAHDAARDLRLEPGSVKPLLVEAVQDLLPPDAARAPKAGFTLPLEMWMRNELHAEVESMMNVHSATAVGLDHLKVKKIWQHFLSGRQGINWSRPWALYTLMRWAQQNNVTTSFLD